MFCLLSEPFGYIVYVNFISPKSKIKLQTFFGYYFISLEYFKKLLQE
jgi:hypothetical protein